MQTKRTAPIMIGGLILLVLAVVTGYLLYAIPESDANRLNHKLAALRSNHSGLAAELAAANRRAAAANRHAAAADRRTQTANARADKAFAKGHAKGLADAAASAQSRYGAGYAAGNAAAFGRYGGNWANGAFYVIHIAPGANGSHQISARALLQNCLAVYGQNGAVWVQGPAC